MILESVDPQGDVHLIGRMETDAMVDVNETDCCARPLRNESFINVYEGGKISIKVVTVISLLRISGQFSLNDD